MKLLYLVSFVISLYSCKDFDNKNVTTRHNPVPSKDTFSIVTECIKRDTTTKLGTNIHYIYKNGKFQIKWGNNNYNRTYDSLFTCDYDTISGIWDFVPKYNSETSNSLVFTNIIWTSSGGNPAPLEFSAIVFPKNLTDTIYEKDFFINSTEGYLIYGDGFNEAIVHIINLETKKTQSILLTPKPALSRSPTLSIKEVKIDRSILSVEYETLNKNDDVITVKKALQVKI